MLTLKKKKLRKIHLIEENNIYRIECDKSHEDDYHGEIAILDEIDFARLFRNTYDYKSIHKERFWIVLCDENIKIIGIVELPIKNYISENLMDVLRVPIMVNAPYILFIGVKIIRGHRIAIQGILPRPTNEEIDKFFRIQEKIILSKIGIHLIDHLMIGPVLCWSIYMRLQDDEPSD